MKNVCLLLAGAALVAAKTGKTLDPMYDAESVCKDWWHAAEEGCFDPANPDADRRWPDAQLEAIFTEALEGREPGACASCGYGSIDAGVGTDVVTSTDCVSYESPYQLIRIYEDCSGICVDAKTKENLKTKGSKGVQFPYNPWNDEGGACKAWPWPQCLDGTLRPTPKPTPKPTDDECSGKYHVDGCYDPSEPDADTSFPPGFDGLMTFALERRLRPERLRLRRGEAQAVQQRRRGRGERSPSRPVTCGTCEPGAVSAASLEDVTGLDNDATPPPYLADCDLTVQGCNPLIPDFDGAATLSISLSVLIVAAALTAQVM